MVDRTVMIHWSFSIKINGHSELVTRISESYYWIYEQTDLTFIEFQGDFIFDPIWKLIQWYWVSDIFPVVFCTTELNFDVKNTRWPKVPDVLTGNIPIFFGIDLLYGGYYNVTAY